MALSSSTIRKLRRSYNVAGHARELTFSCNGRMPMLSKDRTRQWFIEALDKARTKLHFELWAYVIMPEHVHVLLLPLAPGAEIAPILKAVKQSVSRKAIAHLRAHAPEWLERLKVTRPTGRVEHRFWQQGGGYDRNIDNAVTTRKVIEYIHNNPVRRGLVDTPTQWEWSSARWYAGETEVKLRMDGPQVSTD